MPVSQGKRQRNTVVVRVATGFSKDRPVFIGGCPRSGTTLLGQMLHAHPLLAMPPETRFVVESWWKRAKFGDLSEEANRVAFGKWVTDTKKTRFKDMQLDRDRVIEAVRNAPPTLGSCSGAVLAEFANAHGAARWGDKRPFHIHVLRLLFRLYPDMQFIHLIRDARGTTASLKKLGWWGWEAPEALERWRRSIKAGIAAREYLGPDQYIELRYEDLVAEPVQELQRLSKFLRIDFDEKMLQHYETGPQLIQKSYHERIAQPVNSAAVERWREDLEPEELALVEKKVGDYLDEFSYPRLTGLPDVPEELEQHYDGIREAPKGAGLKAGDKTNEELQKPKTPKKPKKKGMKRPPPPEDYDYPVTARLTTGQKRLYYLMRARGRT